MDAASQETQRKTSCRWPGGARPPGQGGPSGVGAAGDGGFLDPAGETRLRVGREFGERLLTLCGLLDELAGNLGMSGHLRIVPSAAPPARHDHLDIVLASGKALRFTDPRRFGLALWTCEEPLGHPLLAGLGAEPLEDLSGGDYLFHASRKRTLAVKQFIMEREYRYIDEGCEPLVLTIDPSPFLIQLVPKPKQKLAAFERNPVDFPVKGVSARGIRLNKRPVLAIEQKKKK